MRELLRRVFKLSIPIAAIAVAAGCGGSGSSSSSSSGGSTPAAGTPQKGGTLTILANSAFGVADPAQNYTLQQWALLIDTHDGLVAVQARRRHGGDADRPRPGGGDPAADRRRQDVHLPDPEGHQVLGRHDA